MNVRRPFLGVGLVVAACCAMLGGLAIAGAGHRVATNGDHYRVTAKRLKRELTRAGIEIRFTQPAGEPTPTVSGVGKSGEEGLAFEFQLYPSSDEATVEGLGRLRPRDFGWSAAGPLRRWEPRLRGVLANVAYAQYELYIEEPHVTQRDALRRDAERRRVLRALDDALFNSFPSNDPYAHALSKTS